MFFDSKGTHELEEGDDQGWQQAHNDLFTIKRGRESRGTEEGLANERELQKALSIKHALSAMYRSTMGIGQLYSKTLNKASRTLSTERTGPRF